jgi:hypothetical protein
MKRQRKRVTAAWLLLSIFISMIMLSGIHYHQPVTHISAECADCVHHIHHSGHFTIAAEHIDDCVLCQFLSLVYTAATASLLVLFINFIQRGWFLLHSPIIQRELSLWYTRGPPSLK